MEEYTNIIIKYILNILNKTTYIITLTKYSKTKHASNILPILILA